MARDTDTTLVGIRQADSCANINCPNLPTEGVFVFVTVGAMRLFMCAPCAKALTSVLIRGGIGQVTELEKRVK